MDRKTKLTNLCFGDIIKNDVPKYEKFLNIDKELNIKETVEITKLKSLYKKQLEQIINVIPTLSKLEELITQLRSREIIQGNIKLSIVDHKYIYARANFYYLDRDYKDIRVIVGLTEKYGSDLTLLSNDNTFMNQCYLKLHESMTKEILNKIHNLPK